MRSLMTHLLLNKRITTTEAKAKETSRYVEALITRAKRAYLAENGGGPVDVHARRVVARDINDANVVRELFTEIAAKVANRPGGYTRVVKLGHRHGDGAEMAIIELVDYNMEQDASAVRSRSKSTISRAERVARSKAKAAQKPAAAPVPTPAPAAAEAPVAEQATAAEQTAADETAEQPVAETGPAEESASEAKADEGGDGREAEEKDDTTK
jgi:large subunit ribosomal protein L17